MFRANPVIFDPPSTSRYTAAGRSQRSRGEALVVMIAVSRSTGVSVEGSEAVNARKACRAVADL